MSCLFAQIDYETEIQTIFNNNCISCHGNSGGLSLDSYASLMTGGNSGSVIISGDHSNSLLWKKLIMDKCLQMVNYHHLILI